MIRKWLMVLFLLVAGGCATIGGKPVSEQVPRMSAEELKARLGSPDLVVLDVRTGFTWAASSDKITGAIREDPRDFSNWYDKFPKDKTLVLYCACPHEETSSGLGLLMIKDGYTKVYALKGGWRTWSGQGYPVEPK